MSLPYLKSLKKPELAELADQTDLPHYDDYNKNDLVVVLDRHLRENRSIFSGLKSLSEYYSRLASPPRRGSPVKRETARTPARTPARRSAKKEVKEEEKEETSEGVEEPMPSPVVVSPTPAAARTSTRQSARQTPRQTPRQPVLATVVDPEPSLPASPAAITEAIDAQTLKLRESLEDVWTAPRAFLRATLSSVKAVEIIVLLLESGSLAKELIPIRYLTTTPPVQAAQIPAIPIRVPDLFVFLEGAFWAPFSLWFLTCLFLPLVSAYFINLSWKASSSARRTRSAPSLAQFDPLTFNIVKALLVHIVFGNGFNFFGFYSRYAIGKVVDSVPGGDLGLFTGSAIGGVSALYEAILHRS
ncbi:hypothetical protein N7519_007531 [Penicillium mononematosum]|uniref:uncharacterized protein n=1 Tax=Penicillium mononematosum TaxID=268346 RepID=UPI002546DD00|nr:uncharacterized protein N7519_007531 [Penicillium mononematosum]KAJ6186230.1 hypothetical protein N7519_007531 [Penicillium mononematosum]